MCGRFVSVSTPEQLAESFGVDEIRTESMGERYNVAPTLDVYSVIETDGQRRLGTLRWGFLPFWAKSLKDRAPINARIEGIEEKKTFASAFAKRRCLIPADGFYEWQEREDTTRKQPWYVHDPDDRPLGLAGIWSVWRDPDAAGGDVERGSEPSDVERGSEPGDVERGSEPGDVERGSEPGDEPVFTCAIVTTRARGRMADLHHRMPIVLPERLWDEWLTADPQEAGHLHDVVARADVPRLEARTISDRVNNVRHDGPELLEPGTVE